MSTETRKVVLVVGGSRGIGRQIAVDLARNGYAVAVAAKSASDASTANPFPPDPNSPQSTINTVVREIKEDGGIAIAIKVDVRSYEDVKRMVDETVKTLGRLDVIIYNSGAIWWASVEETPFKRYDLMQQVNASGLYAVVQASMPHFRASGWKGRVVVVSPPIYSRFFRGKTAYAMTKVAMSVLVKGLAMDWKRQEKKDMAVTGIWPATAIESAATGVAKEIVEDLRKPKIFSDAILAILGAPADTVNGVLDLDEEFLRREGVTDFSKYSVILGAEPRRIMPAQFPDLTVEEQDDEGRRMDSAKSRVAKI